MTEIITSIFSLTNLNAVSNEEEQTYPCLTLYNVHSISLQPLLIESASYFTNVQHYLAGLEVGMLPFRDSTINFSDSLLFFIVYNSSLK